MPSFSLRFFICLLLAGGAVRAADRPTVGMLVKVNSKEGFWGEVIAGAQTAADEAGVDLTVRGIRSVTNSAAQIKLLESFANQKIDALVITPISAERLLAPLNAAAAQGLKIVVAESELSADNAFPYVGYDQAELATSAATAFASLLGAQDEVAIFRGASDPTIVYRDKFIIARLKELRPAIRLRLDVFAMSNEVSTTEGKAGLLFQKYPTSRLFIGTASGATSAMVAAAKSLPGLPHVKIAGFGFSLTPDLVQAIEEGTLEMLLCQMPRELGYKSVAAAVALIRGEKVSPKTGISFVVVTRDNLNTPAVQALKPLPATSPAGVVQPKG
jgi:ribose transport system substrate-binding protein